MVDQKERTLRPRNTIFRRTRESIPEMDEPSRPSSKKKRIKATFYLEPEDILAIDHLQSEEFRETGKKPERSVLVSRAIQEYIKSHSNGHASNGV
ncbi:MAG: hypothetical protein L0177_05390 [Chloroflexi bacterium]|nr:hypothetical protein [Chloroflexota bacterium]